MIGIHIVFKRNVLLSVMGIAALWGIIAGCGAGGGKSVSPTRRYTLTTLIDFDNPTNTDAASRIYGDTPSGLSTDGKGNLYLITLDGKDHRQHSFVRYTIQSGKSTIIASFDSENNAAPQGNLIADLNGGFYGTITGVYGNGNGAIFYLNGTTGVLTQTTFIGTDGSFPNPILTPDGSGNYYGTATNGGDQGQGTLFRYNPVSGITLLASFGATAGAFPGGGLLSDGRGNYYGATPAGGSKNAGTLFRYNSTAGLTTLANLDDATGRFANGPFTFTQDGKIIGTMGSGGANGIGTLVEYDPETGKLAVLVTFNGTNGRHPASSLLSDGKGNYYGSTAFGGIDEDGTIFQYNANAGLTTIVIFNGANGSWPTGTLLSDDKDNLYGITVMGGKNGGGTLFKLTPR